MGKIVSLLRESLARAEKKQSAGKKNRDPTIGFCCRSIVGVYFKLLWPKSSARITRQIFEIQFNTIITPRCKINDFFLTGRTEPTLMRLRERTPLFMTWLRDGNFELFFHGFRLMVLRCRPAYFP